MGAPALTPPGALMSPCPYRCPCRCRVDPAPAGPSGRGVRAPRAPIWPPAARTSCGRSRGRFCGCCPVARAWRRPRSRGRHPSAFEPPRVRCAGAAAEAPQNHPRSSSISRTRPVEVRCDAASEARLAPWVYACSNCPRAWPGQPATAACASQHQPCPNSRAGVVAQGVVDRLEAVEVAVQQAQRPPYLMDALGGC